MDPQILDMQGRPEDASAVPTQSGFVFPDIDTMMAVAAEAADEDSGRREALDAVILAGLVSG